MITHNETIFANQSLYGYHCFWKFLNNNTTVPKELDLLYKDTKEIIEIMRQNVLTSYVGIAKDVSAEPRFFAAEASIFTSETPSYTPLCCSSVRYYKSYILLG